MFDVEARRYRHRELFETPADEAVYFPPDRRQELAAALIADNRVRVASCAAEETKKVRSFRDPTSGEAKQKIVREITYRDWRIIGAVGRPGSGRDRRQRYRPHHIRPLHVSAFRRAPDEPGAVRAHAGLVQGQRGAAWRSPVECSLRGSDASHYAQTAVTLGG
mgnify:CR=1 FL=1